MNFGLTNDKEQYDDAVQFRLDAIRDGWECRPTYESESVERAAKLIKEGFVCQIISRTDVGRFKYSAEVTIWGPDHLQILVPKKYDWGVIVAGLKRCMGCQSDNVNVQQVGFAGRYCDKCAPGRRKIDEFPGWTN